MHTTSHQSEKRGQHDIQRSDSIFRVLLAEQDPYRRDRIAEALRLEGYMVSVAADGSDLLDCIGSQLLGEAQHPRSDLVIAAVELTPVSGTYALAALRELGWPTPFILLTREEGPLRVHEQLDAVVLAGPVSAETIRVTASSLLREPSSSGTAAPKEVAPLQKILSLGMSQWLTVLDAVEDMITVHDLDFNVVAANRAAVEGLGIRDGVPGTAKCYWCYHGSAVVPDGCPSCRVMYTNETSTFEMFNQHLGMQVRVTAIPWLDESQRCCGVVHVVSRLHTKLEVSWDEKDQEP